MVKMGHYSLGSIVFPDAVVKISIFPNSTLSKICSKLLKFSTSIFSILYFHKFSSSITVIWYFLPDDYRSAVIIPLRGYHSLLGPQDGGPGAPRIYRPLHLNYSLNWPSLLVY